MSNLSNLQSGNNQAAVIARLVRGDPPNGVDLAGLEKPWNYIAKTVISANGIGRVDAFESALKEINDADQIRAAVFSSDPNFGNTNELTQDDNESTFIPLSVDVPELPENARLSEGLIAEAESAGRWLNDYKAFASKASPMTAMEFHEATGLTILSATVARRARLQVSSTEIYPNLYVLEIAPSTLLRKSTGFSLANNVMEAAGLRFLILPSSMTPESFLLEMSRRKSKDFAAWEQKDQEEWQAERLFAAQRIWLIEEASCLFDSFDQKYRAEFLPIILELYDCPSVKSIFTVGRGRQILREPYLTICGPTTPAALKAHLNNPVYWSNGLWARFALVTPSNHKPNWNFWPEKLEIPSCLVSALNNLGTKKLPMPTFDSSGQVEPVTPAAISLAPQVWERWESYAKALEYDLLLKKCVDSRLHANYGRFATLAIKVATLLATSDWASDGGTSTPMIELKHWARAQIVVESWRASVHRLIESSNRDDKNDDLDTKILRLLTNNPKGISTREFANNLGMTEPRKRQELEQRLGYMKKDGLIQSGKRKPKRGPEAEVWLLSQKQNMIKS